MRFCFCNPHIYPGTTLLSFIFVRDKKKLIRNDKYLYLVDIFKDKSYRAAIFIDGTATSLSGGSSLLKFFSENYFIIRLISFFEIYAWCFINKINPFRTEIFFRKNRLDPDKDVLFGFAFVPDTFLSERMARKSIFTSFKGKKILHATHFFSRTEKVANNIRLTGTRLIVSEANLKKSQYFNKFFGFIDKICILPFVIRDRYRSIGPFHERKSLCLALGTLLEYNVAGEEFEDVWKSHYDFFQVNTLQPMRKIIYENRERLTGSICSYIEPQKTKKEDADSQGLGFYQKWRIFKLGASFSVGKKSGQKYHSMDIVEEYSKYKMFISPEENIGLPSINFIEGMACGCAYIGLDHAMYHDLGLVPGVHYIAYNGTIDDLENKIRYYQKNDDELEEIARKGCMFVRENFSDKRVTENFLENLNNI